MMDTVAPLNTGEVHAKRKVVGSLPHRVGSISTSYSQGIIVGISALCKYNYAYVYGHRW